MKPQKVMICLNGQAPTLETLLSVIPQVQYIVAADGGVNWMMDYGIAPHLVIGDLDSADPEHLKKVPWRKVKDQYSTDLEKAFSHVMDEGASEVYLLGIEAGRVDHFLSNFFLLSQYATKLTLRIIGDDWVGVFLKNNNQLEIQKDTVVSLLPFSECKGVTLQGFEYPLIKGAFSLGQVGVSNIAIETTCSIQLESGVLLGIFYDKNLQWTVL